MTKTMVTAKLAPPRGEYDVMMLIVTLDKDKRILKGPHFGWWGTLSSEDFWPFRLTTDGRIDSGAALDDANRYFKTNVRERVMEQGALFSTDEDDGSARAYRVERVEDFR